MSNKKQLREILKSMIRDDLANMIGEELQYLLNPIPVAALVLDQVDEKLGQGAISDDIYEEVLMTIVIAAKNLDILTHLLTADPGQYERPGIVSKARARWEQTD